MNRLDLNLLATLDALLCERSVSGAARRMGVGQPAMSASLARLRTLLDDPILVRDGARMQLTPRARALAEPLRATLAQLAQIVEPARPFDPASSSRRFRVSGGDYVGMTILPGLVSEMAASTGIDLRFRFLEKDAALAALDEDALDLAMLVIEDLPPTYEAEKLFEETFVGAARICNPLFGAPIDVERYAAFDHLLVTERADATGVVDQHLAERGLSRRVAITVPSAALVADLLRETDLIATVPRRAAERMAEGGAIRLFEPPLAMPGWEMKMVWARRNAHDPSLRWLRERVLFAAEAAACSTTPAG